MSNSNDNLFCSTLVVDDVMLALNGLTPVPVSVPVPGALWLMGTALAGLGWYGRRRRSA